MLTFIEDGSERVIVVWDKKIVADLRLRRGEWVLKEIRGGLAATEVNEIANKMYTLNYEYIPF